MKNQTLYVHKGLILMRKVAAKRFNGAMRSICAWDTDEERRFVESFSHLYDRVSPGFRPILCDWIFGAKQIQVEAFSKLYRKLDPKYRTLLCEWIFGKSKLLESFSKIYGTLPALYRDLAVEWLFAEKPFVDGPLFAFWETYPIPFAYRKLLFETPWFRFLDELIKLDWTLAILFHKGQIRLGSLVFYRALPPSYRKFLLSPLNSDDDFDVYDFERKLACLFGLIRRLNFPIQDWRLDKFGRKIFVSFASSAPKSTWRCRKKETNQFRCARRKSPLEAPRPPPQVSLCETFAR